MAKKVKLTRIEKAIMILAEHVDRCPYNDYDVEKEVLEALGIEILKP